MAEALPSSVASVAAEHLISRKFYQTLSWSSPARPDPTRPDPGPERHGPSVPQPQRAPTAAAGTSGPPDFVADAFLPHYPRTGPQSLPLSCRPRSLFQESLGPKGLSSLEAARRSGLGGGGSGSGRGGSAALPAAPAGTRSGGAPRCRLWRLGYGRGMGQGRAAGGLERRGGRDMKKGSPGASPGRARSSGDDP